MDSPEGAQYSCVGAGFMLKFGRLRIIFTSGKPTGDQQGERHTQAGNHPPSCIPNLVSLCFILFAEPIGISLRSNTAELRIREMKPCGVDPREANSFKIHIVTRARCSCQAPVPGTYDVVAKYILHLAKVSQWVMHSHRSKSAVGEVPP
mgnify:CR=1 FL=1